MDFTDEAGVHSQRVSDGLGRLTAVVEPDQNTGALKTETDYTYDLLDNLTSVRQNGNPSLNNSNMPETPRSRSFTYDSLSRLITAANPETGTMCYGVWSGGACVGGYDANGNLSAKTDANGMTISYRYDALNRMVSKAAPDIDNLYAGFWYDQGANGVGRLSGQSRNDVAGETYAYDVMGRVINTGYHNYELDSGTSNFDQGMHVGYDLAGNPTQLTYPDGRVVNQTWDGAGRLQTITDAQSGMPYFGAPSGQTQYWPSGALANAQLGSSVTESFGLNNRLQPVTALASTSLLPNPSAGNLINRQSFYTPVGSTQCPTQSSGNNGNIFAIIDNLQAGLTQVFSYDGLNRLNCATRSDNVYRHTYGYDSFGNMAVHDLVQGDMGDTIDPATNRMYIHGGYLSYDNVGNLTGVPSPTGGPATTFQYTAEGYLRCLNNCTSGGSYLVDGLGQRT